MTTEITPTDIINDNFEAAKTAISNCAPLSLVQTVNGKQDKIDSSHKLSADLITNGTTNKFVTKTSELTNDRGFLTSHQDISGKADKSTTLAGYGITNAYTKTETDTAISTAIAGTSHLVRLVVTQLPSVENADLNTIYMILKSSGASGNRYDEYMAINGEWEKIGDTEVSLEGYVTSVNNVSPVNGNVTLSIPDAQIQSDWTQTTTTAKDYIKNKPTLATVATSGSYNDLSNKPTIPSAVTESTVSGWGFTKNAGTITGITMNGSSKGTSGVVDLGTVITAHQDISGKVDKTSIVSTVSASSTNAQVVGAKLFYDTVGNIESLLSQV